MTPAGFRQNSCRAEVGLIENGRATASTPSEGTEVPSTPAARPSTRNASSRTEGQCPTHAGSGSPAPVPSHLTFNFFFLVFFF